MKRMILKGATSQSCYIFIRDSSATTGVGLTGLAFNTASLVASYVRPLGSRTAITLATQTVTGAFSSGGFVEVDATNMPGVYRLDIPDAVIASGVDSAIVMLKGAANMEPVVMEFQLSAINIQDGVRAGMTALPNAAAAAAGGVPILGTNATAISFTAGMTISNAGGSGLTLSSGGSNGSGLVASGNGSGSGVLATGGATGPGVSAVGGATSGPGINAAATSGNGMTATGGGTGSGIVATSGSGATGDGIRAVAASTNGSGATLAKAGSGSDLNATSTPLALAKTTNISGFNDLSAAQVNAEADAALADVGLTSYTAPDNASISAIGAIVTAIQAVTDKVDTTLQAQSGTSGYQFTEDALALSPAGGAAPTASEVADAVWDEILSGHSGVGSTGAALAAAGGSGDPWATSLPGAYGAGTAGNIIGNQLDAAITSRLAAAGYTAPDNASIAAILVDTAEIGAAGAGLTALASATALATVDSVVDAIQAKTDNLPTDPADESLIIAATDAIMARLGAPAGASVSADVAAVLASVALRLLTSAYTAPLDSAGTRTAVGLASANLDTQLGTIDTVADAIKAKTDSLTFTVANNLDTNVQYVNDAQVTGDGQPGTEWGPA